VEYLYRNLGHRNRGDIVRVRLTSAANVQLLTPGQYQNYRNGRDYQYRGGLAKTSPFEIVVPNSGHWYVVVDTRGLRNGTRASIDVIPAAAIQPLPEARSARSTPVGEIAEHYAEAVQGSDSREYDVFISHASEDKEGFVRPLAHALRDHGLAVWYDEFALSVGDSLRRKIDQGIANSRFGVVVISPKFIVKGWTNQELDGLMVRAVDGEQILLPIWHNISRDEVVRYSPMLADKVALNTSTATTEEIAAEIAAAIQNR